MYEEEIEQDNQQVASEPEIVEVTEDNIEQEDTQKMVPLAALKATRKKLQEAEARAQLYQEYLNSRQESKEEVEEEDPNALVEKKLLKETTANTKREILETLYQDINPKAVQEINKYLKPILEKKPWLAASVDSAPNRYARAYEIVQDYMHLVDEKPKSIRSHNNDGERIVQNSQKPRSPAEIGKSARPEGLEYLKSIQGKKEFREYRQKVLRGEM